MAKIWSSDKNHNVKSPVRDEERNNLPDEIKKKIISYIFPRKGRKGRKGKTRKER